MLACVRVGLERTQAATEAAQRVPGSGLARPQAMLRSCARINMEHFGRCVIHTDDAMLSPANRREFRAIKRQIDQAIRAMIEEAVSTGRRAGIARTDPVGAEQIADSLVQFLTEGLRSHEH